MIANKYQIIGQRLGLIIENTLGRKSVFSEKIGRDQSQLSRILKGESRLTQDILESLAEYFNVNINWLLTGEGEMFISEIDPEIKENLGNYAWIPRYDLVVRGGTRKFSA